MLRVWDLPVLALICAVLWAVIRLITRAPVRRVASEALFVGYLGALLYVTLFLPLSAESATHGFGWAAVNLVPAHTIVRIIRDYRGKAILQLAGNVVMFAPLGFLLPLLGTRFRRFLVTVVVGLSVSLGIELIQLAMLLTLIARRAVDIDDVILNVAGACLGYLLWWVARALVRPDWERAGVVEDAA